MGSRGDQGSQGVSVGRGPWSADAEEWVRFHWAGEGAWRAEAWDPPGLFSCLYNGLLVWPGGTTSLGGWVPDISSGEH